jgi:hypothetical protein
VYGCLGGSTFGVLAWIIVQAVHADEWLTAAVTVLFGSLVVLAGGRTWMRDPAMRLPVMFQTVALLGLFTVGAAALHWRDWTKAAGAQTTAVQGILIGSGLTATALGIAAFLWLRRHWPRAGNQRHDHNRLILVALVPLLLSAASCQRAAAKNSRAESQALPNGIRIVSVHFPDSTNMAIFTYVPMGLVMDGPQQTQWSHLVEHLVIRSTVPGDLSVANAETLPDHMRLDFYGNVSNWKEGLSHHQRWLQGVPFTQASLEAEKPKVRSEADYTVRNLATHKFAMAAWAQGFRHGQTNAAIQQDIGRVSLNDIQSYRDNHLPVLSNVVVCIVGGVEPAKVLPIVSEQLASIKPSGKLAAPVKLHPEIVK